MTYLNRPRGFSEYLGVFTFYFLTFGLFHSTVSGAVAVYDAHQIVQEEYERGGIVECSVMLTLFKRVKPVCAYG